MKKAVPSAGGGGMSCTLNLKPYAVEKAEF